jgi:menaquinone-dependent protoporphyrinogen oxidase
MSKFLIVYGSTEGHTKQIAQAMASAIYRDGHQVDLRDSKDVRKETIVDRYDGVLVGGSIHAGDYQGSLREFAKLNRDVLDRAPSAFFSVSLAAADLDDEARAELDAIVDKFARETGWRPKRVEMIAGALVYTQYNFFIRRIMKMIVKQQGRTELDTSRDYDFTDWDAVEAFARDFARSAAPAASPA